MATTISSIETQHEDMIHDVQLDYYSRRLATCSSDRTIKIFEVSENSNVQVAEIKGHEGPVWQIAWGHPKFGSILASCSYDRKVCIWKENTQNNWSKLYEYNQHESSVNSIAWSPHEYGLSLVCASSDCTISVLTHKGENVWDVFRIPQAHAIGVNAVSWAPPSYIQSNTSNTNADSTSIVTGSSSSSPNRQFIKRFASGGCDNLVKIWRYYENEGSTSGSSGVWKVEEVLECHSDWVRDVAWAPNIHAISQVSTIASCSQDGTVIIWSRGDADGNVNGNSNWNKKSLPKFPDVVWRVSWSITGNILAISGGDNHITLWKESPDSEWKCISSVEESQEHS